MQPQSVHSTLVSHVVSALVSVLGFGALSIQTGFYLLSLGQRETRIERATVLVLWIMSLAQSVVDCTGAIRYLSRDLSDVSLAASAKIYVEFTISPLLGIFMIGICHVFVANRILSFASSVQTSAAGLQRTVFWMVCIAVAFCCLLGLCSIAVVWATLVLLPQGRVTMASVKAFNILSAVYSFCCCAIDISLAVFVAWETAKAKSLTSTSANSVLRTLLRISVCSAVVTVLAQAFKSTLVFLMLVGWAGVAFNVACAAYPVALLLSISLPRAKSSQLSHGQGCSHGPSSNDFFSPSKSHDFASSSLVPQYGSNSSPTAIGELEKQAYASLSRSPSRDDAEMGLAQMLEESERELGDTPGSALGVQILGMPMGSLPSSPVLGGGGTRPSSPSRMMSFAGPRQRPSSTPLLANNTTSTYSPTSVHTSSFSGNVHHSPYTYPSQPPSTYEVHLDSPPLAHNAPIARSSSLIRPRMERRLTSTPAPPPSPGPKSSSMGDVPGSQGDELNLEYIFSGLMVHSIAPPTTKSKKS